MLEVTTSQQKKTSQRNFADKAESEFSNSQRKLSKGQMFESRGMRLVRESVGNKSAKLYQPYLKLGYISQKNYKQIALQS